MPMSRERWRTTKTFRGRTLEELLPQIRAELGPDAIVLRRREGLAGGVGGFFQRSYVEVEARGPLPSRRATLEPRNDRATAEGLARRRPGARRAGRAVRRRARARAERDGAPTRAADVLRRRPRPRAPPGSTARSRTAAPPPEPPAPSARAASRSSSPTRGARARREPPGREPAPRRRPRPAPARRATAEQRLVAAGLSAGLAADVVGEAVAHGLPFAHAAQPQEARPLRARPPHPRARRPRARPPRDRRRRRRRRRQDHARSATSRPRTPPADHEVVVVALRVPRRRRRARARELEPLGVSVIAASDAAQAARRLRRRERAGPLVDTPALGSGDAPGRRRARAPSCARSAPTEVHLAAPGDDQRRGRRRARRRARRRSASRTSPSRTPTRPPAPARRSSSPSARAGPLSYVATRDGVEPADPAALAAAAAAMSRLRSRYVVVQLPHARRAARDRGVARTTRRSCSRSPSRRRPASAASPGATVRIECISPRGIQRVTGAVAWSPEQPEFLRVAKESDDVIQRREAVRVQAVVPALLTVLAVPAWSGPSRPPSRSRAAA